MRYGRFVDGVIVELFSPPDGFTIEDCFHPDVVFEPVPSNAELGWSKNEEGIVVDPNAPPPLTEEDLVPEVLPEPPLNAHPEPTPTE